MDEKISCKNGEEKTACVPFFVHENDMMHYNRANKRMLIALIVSVVVLTIGFIIMGRMFLKAYNEREAGWQNIIQQKITEAADGRIYEQPGT